MSKRSAQVANFNIVFGDKEQPMLDFSTRLFIRAMGIRLSLYPHCSSGGNSRRQKVLLL